MNQRSGRMVGGTWNLVDRFVGVVVSQLLACLLARPSKFPGYREACFPNTSFLLAMVLTGFPRSALAVLSP